MRKITIETSSASHPKEGRLLARVLAEDLRRVQGQESEVPVEYLVTGEIRRDWSDPEFEGYPAF